MNVAIKQPPNVNGEMELTEVQKTNIKAKLLVIQDAFVETDEQSVCDTFYLTATYNKENAFKINGDTCEMLLAEEETPIEEG
jgi:hypothetical protein